MNSNLSNVEESVAGLNENLGNIIYKQMITEEEIYLLPMFRISEGYKLRGFITTYTEDGIYYFTNNLAKIENDMFYANNTEGFKSGTTVQVIAFFDI